MTSESVDRDRQSIVDDLANQDEEIRRLAVERLLSLPSEESIPRLVDALGDSSWRVRKAAVGRVGRCDDLARLCDSLIGALADGENTGRRNAAVEALVSMGSRALAALVDALTSEDVDVRKLVVDAIAGIGDESAREVVVGVLDDADPNVRGAAADALGLMGGDIAADALRRAATADHEDRLVRLSALRSLARLDVAMSPGELGSVLSDSVLAPAGLTLLGNSTDREDIDCLLKGLASGSRASREAAMDSLLRVMGSLDGDEADRLIDDVRTAGRASDLLVAGSIERLGEADLAMRIVLIQFLGIIAAPGCVIPILEAGRDEAVAEIAHSALESMGDVMESEFDAAWADLGVELRCDACILLGRTGGELGERRLLGALDDTDSELRAAAARSLGQRHCPEAIPLLVRRLEAAALEDDLEADEELGALVEALVELAGPGHDAQERLTAEAIELLSIRLDGSAEAVRLSIATVLGQIGRPEDAELVASLLKDPSDQVRRAAVEALSRLEPGAASEPIRLALADESAVVRIAAAGALGASENVHVIDDLRRLLHDEDARVRAAALRAIGRHSAALEDPTATDDAVALIEHSLDGEGIVAMAGLEALRSVGGDAAARVAVKALDSPEPEIVQAAVSCIAQHGDSSVVRELLSLVAHPNWGVRADVIQTLADRRVAQAVPPILRRLETEQDSFVRDAILRALKRLEA